MIEPSSIRPPDDHVRVIREIKPGLYRVENAYEGEYVYFENDPEKVVPEGETELTEEESE
jgi:hypothetical protein